MLASMTNIVDGSSNIPMLKPVRIVNSNIPQGDNRKTIFAACAESL